MPRPERAIRTHAIILKRRDFNEADRLLTIFTPEHGKMDVVAKGARKPVSQRTGHVELFTRADMLIHTGREIGVAAQVDMVDAYLGLREDLVRGAYANYTVELLDRFTPETDPEISQPLFALLADTLARVANDEDPRLAVRYYEMRLLDVTGFRPDLQYCAVGHEPIQPEDQFFSYEMGGVVCPRHANPQMTLLPLSMNALKLLRHMQRSSYATVQALKLSMSIHDEAERALLGYLTYLLERKLQSVEFIKRIRRV
jgi:DNA repair protein RecO (recombination protein O)